MPVSEPVSAYLFQDDQVISQGNVIFDVPLDMTGVITLRGACEGDTLLLASPAGLFYQRDVLDSGQFTINLGPGWTGLEVRPQLFPPSTTLLDVITFSGLTSATLYRPGQPSEVLDFGCTGINCTITLPFTPTLPINEAGTIRLTNGPGQWTAMEIYDVGGPTGHRSGFTGNRDMALSFPKYLAGTWSTLVIEARELLEPVVAGELMIGRPYSAAWLDASLGQGPPAAVLMGYHTDDLWGKPEDDIITLNLYEVFTPGPIPHSITDTWNQDVQVVGGGTDFNLPGESDTFVDFGRYR